MAALNVHLEMASVALDHILTVTSDTKENIIKRDKEIRAKRKRGEEKNDLRMMGTVPADTNAEQHSLMLLGQETVHGGDVDDSFLQGALTFADCSSLVLQDILSWTEPASMSKHALKALPPPGRRSIAKDRLLELLEFGLGLDRQVKLKGAIRDKRTLETQLRNINEQRGQRLMQLVLPTNWAECGVYGITFAGTEVTVKHKFTGLMTTITLGWDKTAVEHNYSEKRACLVQVGGLGHLLCAKLLGASNQRMVAPPSPTTRASQRSELQQVLRGVRRPLLWQRL